MTSSKSTQNEAQSLESKLELLREKYNSRAIGSVTNPRHSISKVGTYPGRYFARNPEEKKFALLHEHTKHLAQAYDVNNGYSNIDIKYDPHAEIDMVLQRNNEMELYQFDQFVQNICDIYDPTQQKIIEELQPGWFSRKEAEFKSVGKLQQNIANLDLRGIKTKEDLILMYLISKGEVNVPHQGVHRTQELVKEADFDRTMFVERVHNKKFQPGHVGHQMLVPDILSDDKTKTLGTYTYGAKDILLPWKTSRNVIDTVLTGLAPSRSPFNISDIV